MHFSAALFFLSFAVLSNAQTIENLYLTTPSQSSASQITVSSSVTFSCTPSPSPSSSSLVYLWSIQSVASGVGIVAATLTSSLTVGVKEKGVFRVSVRASDKARIVLLNSNGGQTQEIDYLVVGVTIVPGNAAARTGVVAVLAPGAGSAVDVVAAGGPLPRWLTRAVNAAGLPLAAAWMEVVVVDQAASCLALNVDLPAVLERGSRYTARFSVSGGSFASGSAVSAAQATSLWVSAGLVPAVSVAGGAVTLLGPPTPGSAARDGWTARVATIDEPASVALALSGRGNAMLGCPVSTAHVPITLQLFAAVLGTALPTGVPVAGAALTTVQRLSALGSAAAGLSDSMSPCSGNSGIALLRVSPSGPGTGALLLVTEDSFGGSTTLVDLSVDLAAAGFPAGTGLVQALVTSRRRLLALTTTGALLLSSDLSAISARDEMSNGTATITERAVVTFTRLALPAAAGPQLPVDGRARLHASPVCPVRDPVTGLAAYDPVHVTVDGAPPRVFESFDPDHALWTEVSLPAGTVLGNATRCLSVLRDAATRSTVALFALSAPLAGAATVVARAASNSTSGGAFVPGVRFSAVEAVTGLAAHVSGAGILAFGASLHVSMDGARSFGLVGSLSVTGRPDSPILQVRTCRARGQIALLRADGRVLYTKMGVSDIAEVFAVGSSSAAALTTLVFDSVGDLYAARVAAGAAALAASPSVLAPVQSWLSRLRVPVGPMLLARKVSLPGPATLVVDSGGSLRLELPAGSSKANVTSVTPRRILFADGGYMTVQRLEGGTALVGSASATDGVAPAPASLTPAQLRAAVFTPSSPSSPSSTPSTITLQPGAGPGWLYSDVGKTVSLGFGALLCTRLVSATVMEVSVAVAPVVATAAQPGQWSVYSTRAYREYALVDVAQTLTVTGGAAAAPGTAVLLRLSAGFMAFDAALHTGMVASVRGAGWAQVVDVLSAAEAIAVVVQALPGGVVGGAPLSGAEWSLYQPGPSFAAYAQLPHLADTLVGDMAVALEPCAYDATVVRSHLSWMGADDILDATSVGEDVLDPTPSPDPSPDVFVDRGESVTLSFQTLPFVDTGDEEQGSAGSLLFYSTNPALGATLSAHRRGSSNGFDSSLLDVTLQDTARAALSDEPAQTTVAAFSRGSTLLCDKPQVPQRVVFGCPPSLRLVEDRPRFYWDNIIADYKSGRGRSGFSFEPLPANYRPPSKEGRGVPTTDNIYNGDPSKPMYNNRFPVSKATGRYKRCAGAKDRAGCKCLEPDTFSELLADTDCLTHARKVLFLEPFSPALKIVQDGVEKPLANAKFIVKELNGRTDFCFNITDTCITGDHLTTPLPQNGAIVFRGDGLFHFSFILDPQLTRCTLSKEEIVFVTRAPLDTTKYNVIVSSTAVAVSLSLFIGYYFYQRTYGRLRGSG